MIHKILLIYITHEKQHHCTQSSIHSCCKRRKVNPKSLRITFPQLVFGVAQRVIIFSEKFGCHDVSDRSGDNKTLIFSYETKKKKEKEKPFMVNETELHYYFFVKFRKPI